MEDLTISPTAEQRTKNKKVTIYGLKRIYSSDLLSKKILPSATIGEGSAIRAS